MQNKFQTEKHNHAETRRACMLDSVYSIFLLLKSLLTVDEFKQSREHADQNLRNKIDEIEAKNHRLRTEKDATEKSISDLRRQVAHLTAYNNRRKSPLNQFKRNITDA